MATYVKNFRRYVAVIFLLSMCITTLFLNELFHVPNYIKHIALRTKNVFTPMSNRNIEDMTVHNCSYLYQQAHLMRITDSSGRLGNNVFRLISLLATARKYCYRPVLKKQKFPLLQETFDLSIFGDEPNELDDKQWRNFSEVHCCRYNNEVEQLNTTFNWTLNGFLQSWRYSAGAETYVRSILQFHNGVLKQVNTFYHNLRAVNSISGNSLFVGVHVRRGDFVNNSNGYITASPQYLNKSMQFFREKFLNHRVIFIIASNGMEWTKEYTKGEDVYYTEQSDSVDFAILSMCNHSIVTSGSYGYLTAWLSGGFVVYCSDFPTPLSWLDKQFNHTDYYPPHWIPMTNEQ